MPSEEQEQPTRVATNEEGADKAEHIVSTTNSSQQITVVVYEHYCKGCEICCDVCPKEVLEMVVASDRWEGALVKVVNIDNCNGCMLCEYECPDFAIEVFSAKKEAKKKEK